jgi:hypothetical protein
MGGIGVIPFQGKKKKKLRDLIKSPSSDGEGYSRRLPMALIVEIYPS